MSRLPRAARITLKRVLVAALGCLALAAQLGATVHLVVVQHVVCAEHGELVELSPSHDAMVTRHDGVSLLGDRRGVAHEHDHCSLGLLRRELSVHSRVVEPGVAATTPDASGGPVVFEAPARAIALLDLAPKSSPPV